MRHPFHPLLAPFVLAAIPACTPDVSAGQDNFGSMTDTSGSSETGSSSDTSTTGPGETSEGDEEDSGEGPGPKFDLDPDGDLPSGGGLIPETCEEAALAFSTVGCRFFAIDLKNFVDVYDELQYAIVIANVQTEGDANVVVEVKENGNWVEATPAQDISPLDLFVFEVPNRVQNSGIGIGGAYRITSDLPVVAYQFNPFEIQGGLRHTTDASMLYPVAAWDTDNLVVAHVHAYSAFFTVAAAIDGTVVDIVSTGGNWSGPGIPWNPDPSEYSFDLDEGDVVTLKGLFLADFTGSTVKSNDDHPVAVFTGNSCANVPADTGSCDHMEEQLSGLRLWGKEFVAPSMPVRQAPANAPEPTMWQIVGSVDDTEVTIVAPAEVTGLPASPFTLDRGEKVEFMASGTHAVPGDFRINATEPVAVMSYLVSQGMLDLPVPGASGDPSNLQMPAAEQFLPRYVVLVPNNFPEDYLTITRPTGVEVLLDGLPMDDSKFHDIGGGWEVGRHLVEDGVHELASEDPFGVTVVGLHFADSYAYAGGAGTAPINPDPEG